MSRIDTLKKNYQRLCEMPWERRIAGPQRVWLAVYDKEDERRLRLRMSLFEQATIQAGKHWHAIDLTDSFPRWLRDTSYCEFAESYFERPVRLGRAALDAFQASVAGQLVDLLRSVEHSEDAVVAVYGVASLFGFLHVSELLPKVQDEIRGRLLVFFPGVYEHNNYRLLEARDGWNYQAIPITAA